MLKQQGTLHATRNGRISWLRKYRRLTVLRRCRTGNSAQPRSDLVSSVLQAGRSAQGVPRPHTYAYKRTSRPCRPRQDCSVFSLFTGPVRNRSADYGGHLSERGSLDEPSGHFGARAWVVVASACVGEWAQASERACVRACVHLCARWVSEWRSSCVRALGHERTCVPCRSSCNP